MRSSNILATTLGLLFGVHALSLEKRDNPSILKLDLTKKHPSLLPKTHKKRQEVSTPDLNYQKSLLYIVQLKIGTPPQSTFVQLDTGSSDLIVETSSSNLCVAAPPNPCTNFGAYDANNSATYQYSDSNFKVAYGGGDGATGDWGSDVVNIGGAALNGAQFGVMYQTTVTEGILGVSYPILEGRYTFSGEPQYDNLPILLVKQGYIASRAFSLWTNDDRSTSGTLLFGGVDTSKFSGSLVTIDLVPSGFDGFSGVVDFTLSLNGVSGTDVNGHPVTFTGGTTPINVIMDSGTTFTLLPQALATSIWAFVGAAPYSNDPTLAYILCSAGQSTQTINFSFNGITIAVPLSQLVVFPDSNNVYCTFGIAIDSVYIIGDSVLTAMYVVYDLDNEQISLAPTVFNSVAPENILQIVVGKGGVPTMAEVSSVSVGLNTSSMSNTSSTSSTSSTSTPSISSNSPAASSSSSTTSSSSITSSYQNNSFSPAASSSLSTTLISSTTMAISNFLSRSTPLAAPSTLHTSTAPTSTIPTSTTISTTPSSSPLVCNRDNCFRAVWKPSNLVFCSAYVTGAPTTVPSDIAKGCVSSASRVSSACGCLMSLS